VEKFWRWIKHFSRAREVFEPSLIMLGKMMSKERLRNPISGPPQPDFLAISMALKSRSQVIRAICPREVFLETDSIYCLLEKKGPLSPPIHKGNPQSSGITRISKKKWQHPTASKSTRLNVTARTHAASVSSIIAKIRVF